MELQCIDEIFLEINNEQALLLYFSYTMYIIYKYIYNVQCILYLCANQT